MDSLLQGAFSLLRALFFNGTFPDITALAAAINCNGDFELLQKTANNLYENPSEDLKKTLCSCILNLLQIFNPPTNIVDLINNLPNTIDSLSESIILSSQTMENAFSGMILGYMCKSCEELHKKDLLQVLFEQKLVCFASCSELLCIFDEIDDAFDALVQKLHCNQLVLK